MANTVFDMPIYEELFRTVREVNRSLPAGERLRVLLGDPPIDWTKISSGDEILELMYERDAFAADLIRKEVLGKTSPRAAAVCRWPFIPKGRGNRA